MWRFNLKWLYMSSISQNWFQITFETFVQQALYLHIAYMHRHENWHWQSKAFCAFSKVFALNSIMIWVSIAEICNPTSLNVAIQKVFLWQGLSVMICALRTFSSRKPTHPLVKRYTGEAQIRWLMVWRASYFCVATKWSSLRFKQRYAGLTEVKRSIKNRQSVKRSVILKGHTSTQEHLIYFLS